MIQQRVTTPVPTNHVFHLLMTLLTCGLWLFVWLPVWAINSMRSKEIVRWTQEQYSPVPPAMGLPSWPAQTDAGGVAHPGSAPGPSSVTEGRYDLLRPSYVARFSPAPHPPQPTCTLACSEGHTYQVGCVQAR